MRKPFFLFLSLVSIMILMGCSFTPPSEQQAMKPTKEMVAPKGETIASYPSSQLPAVIRQQAKVNEKFMSLSQIEVIEIGEITESPKISNVWRDATLGSVLQDISGELSQQSSPIRLILDESVEGRIGFLEVNELPIEDALRKVFLACPGFTFRKIGDDYLVGSALPSSLNAANLFETKVFATNKTAEEIMSLLPATIDKQFLRANGHQLIITAPVETIECLGKALGFVDQIEPQIVIEAMICESRTNTGSTLGIQWPEVLGIDISAELKNGGAYTAIANSSVFPKLNFAAQKGELEIKVSPRIFASDGEQAEIKVTKEKYTPLYESNSSQPGGGVYYTPYFEAKPLESGVTLKVTPCLIGETGIMLTLEIEVSEFEQADGDNALPVINKSTTKTVVRVESGDTIVIGGLKQQRRQRVQSGLPDSSFLLKKETKEMQDTELTIFVTPAILRL